MIPRSYLYVSGATPERFAKAMASGADAVILDLEDSVPAAGKDAARAAVADFVTGRDPGTLEVWVRLNAGPLRTADLAAVAGAASLTGLCPAKVESAAELEEIRSGLRDGLLLEPLLESAAALFAAREIAAAARVRRVHVGELDLAADLGVPVDAPDPGMGWARGAVVAASAAAGAEAPIAPASTELRDIAGFRATTEAFRALGFWGRACVHPRQVPVCNEVFTPAPAEVARARAVLDALTEADASGRGAAVDPSGRLVDEAVARSARRVLRRAAAVADPPTQDGG